MKAEVAPIVLSVHVPLAAFDGRRVRPVRVAGGHGRLAHERAVPGGPGLAAHVPAGARVAIVVADAIEFSEQALGAVHEAIAVVAVG